MSGNSIIWSDNKSTANIASNLGLGFLVAALLELESGFAFGVKVQATISFTDLNIICICQAASRISLDLPRSAVPLFLQNELCCFISISSV